ncbi:MAG: CRTAC1 family protein [Planctomycetaceae bacterium]|nr:CRTAC1 family protein [Planctomycetaceae bacterium]
MKPASLLILCLIIVVPATVFIYWMSREATDSPGELPAPPDVSLSKPEPNSTATNTSGTSTFFEDVTKTSGIAFTCHTGEEANRFTILESLGGGVALLDYDLDGLLDIYCAGGGTFEGDNSPQIRGLSAGLFRNLGNFRFQDVTQSSGIVTDSLYSHGAIAADYDCDGRDDLLITGYSGMLLFRNEGDGKFRDVTASVGLTNTNWSTSAAFADLTGNGKADLYVSRYVNWSFQNDPKCQPRGSDQERDVCPPQSFDALPHSLYQFDGTQFTDHWETLNIPTTGKGLGVVIADLNDDGRPDVYASNDASNNWLLLNRGEGKFDEAGLAAGVAADDSGRYNGSMGVDVGDYDGSGRASLWVTNFESELPALYQNVGSELFAFQSQAAGIGALGGTHVGFGTSFIDMDNDGWQDIIFVNGHVVRYPAGAPVKQKPVLLRNEEQKGRRVFRSINSSGNDYFNEEALGRGLAVGDLDNDGWPDLVISHSNTPVRILKNVASTSNANHWAGFSLAGRSHRPIAGATITVRAADRSITRFAKSGGSYLSTSDSRILFGLGNTNQPVSVTVRWPWGETQTWNDLAIDQYWKLNEDSPNATNSSPPELVREGSSER